MNSEPTSKPFIKSKTAWVMAIAFLAGFLPPAKEWLDTNPVPLFQALAAAGLLLRFVTRGKVTIFSDDESGNGSSADVSAAGGSKGSGRDTGVAHDDLALQRTAFYPWLVGACAAMLASCGPLKLTPDGCILGSYTRNGQTYWSGPCVDENGKVNRVRVLWENDEGLQVRATIHRDSRATLVEYKIAEGIWVRWTAKSGVMLGPVPVEVSTALEPPKAVVIDPEK